MFEHRHHVEGFVRFIASASVVNVEGRWPFDLHTDEWMYAVNDVALAGYVACLEELAANGRGRVEGVDHGFVEFTEMESVRTQIELCDSAPSAPTRFSVIVAEDASALSRRMRDAVARL